jgi:hypothetical protein
MLALEFYNNTDNQVSAQTYPHIASTRGSFDLTDGTNIQQTDLPSALNILDIENCPGELAIYVHGVWATEYQAEEQTERVFLSLLSSAYNIPVIGFSWDSNTAKNPMGWGIAKLIANQNGQNLANFVLNFKDECPNNDLRIIAHSLGSRVVLSAIQSLYDNYSHDIVSDVVKSVHLLGAAADNEQVSVNNLNECTNVNYPPLKCSGEAISLVIQQFYNLYNSEDNMLAYEEIVVDATPWNWFDQFFSVFSIIYPSPYLITENDTPLGAYEKHSNINAPTNYHEYNVISYIEDDLDSDKLNGCDLEINLINYGWYTNYYYCTITKTGDNHFGYLGYRDDDNRQAIYHTGAMELVVIDWMNE